MSRAHRHQVLVTVALLFLSVSQGCTESPEAPRHETRGEAAIEPLDGELLQQTLGVPITEESGRYRFSIPQNELVVSIDGFDIIPPMGLTSWAVFAPTRAGAVVMGDLVLAEDEIGPAQKTLVASGLTVSALHNHFVRERPKVMFMHIHGMGDAVELAVGVRATLDTITGIRARAGLRSESGSVSSTFEPETITQILGHEGRMSSGVYKVTIGRPDVDLRDGGARVTKTMGFNTWMSFQGTAERAAVSGDFAMLTNEVAPVIRALVTNGIEVVAVHNHMVSDIPHIFFLHFWGVGPIEELARGLKAGLDETAS